MKTHLNVRLLLTLAIGLAVGAFAVIVAHACQTGPEAAALLAEADRAETAGDPARAADYLQRRLTYTPGDVDVLERYGKTLDRTAADKGRVLSVYEEVLAHEPTRQDLRRTAADLALGQGDFLRAARHLERLAHYRPDDGEVQDLLGQCREALGDAEKAESAYRSAVALDPHRVGACVRLARLLRGTLGRASDADDVMDALVTANDRDASAYTERAAWRTVAGSLDGAAEDAAHARELDPDGARVLLTAADVACRRGRIDDARAALRRGLEHHPDDMAPCLALATLELGAGRPKEAADCLQQEKEILKDRETPPDQAELIHLLAEARLQLGETRAVEELAAAEREAGRYAVGAYLAARLQMHEGRWAEAARTLEESAKNSVLSLDQAVCTLLCLGECYAHLGDGDRRLGVLHQAAGYAPASGQVNVALGAALLDAGRTDDALERLRRTTELPGAPAEAWILLARGLLLHEHALPADRQDWREVDRAIDRCGPSPEAARLRAAALRARGDDKAAAAALEKARADHPDDPAAWTAVALDAARRGDTAAASATLDEARRRLGDRVEFRLARLDAFAAASAPAALVPKLLFENGSLADLEKGLDDYAPQDRTRLLCRLAETYYRVGKAAHGDRLCRQLLVAPAADLSARLPLLEAVLASPDDALADAVLADVARLEGKGGAWTAYGQAARLAARACRGDRGGLAEAKTLLNDLSRRRPDWPRVALLRARVAELDGDAAAALDGYQRAFDLGERRPDAAETLARMLAARGRWDDADRVLRKMQEQAVFRGALARLAAEVALRTHDDGRAAEMARRAAPADDAYSYHVWLGRVLAAAGRPAEAEAELRRAVSFPNGNLGTRSSGWDATAALASFLADQGRPADALQSVEELKATLPPRYAALPLAACYEAAGRLDLAEQHYAEAVAKRPADAPTLLRAAAFHLRLDRPARAEELLRRLLDSGTDASAADLAWARRERAMILAADGKPGEATALLGDAPRPGEDAAAFRRAQAFILAARPEGRAEALRRLDAEVKAGPLPADEDFRLARLYDAAGRWPEARDRLTGLLTADRRNPEYLASLIDGLLRHGQAEEAGAWLDRLAALEPGAERVTQFRARLAAPQSDMP